jgi:hypothetical protein
VEQSAAGSVKQNITLSLEKTLVRKARILAAQRSTSVSKLMAMELTRLVEQSDRYEQARKRALADLDTGLHLGGSRPATRDDLHAR